MGIPAIHTDKATLSKTAAHLRWLIEKSGVAPETGAMVVIIVEKKADREKLMRTFDEEFTAGIMSRIPTDRYGITAHGIRITIKAKELV